MGMMQEFKTFATKGNVIDLAVGVIIGAAFSKIVDSLVGDIVMPVVSKYSGGLDFANYYLPLSGQKSDLTLAAAKAEGAVLAYGNFITVSLNFLILAFIIFQMVRLVNMMKKKDAADAAAAPEEPAPTPEDIALLREIRDALKNK